MTVEDDERPLVSIEGASGQRWGGIKARYGGFFLP